MAQIVLKKSEEGVVYLIQRNPYSISQNYLKSKILLQLMRTRKKWNWKTTFKQHFSVFDVVTKIIILLVTS